MTVSAIEHRRTRRPGTIDSKLLGAEVPRTISNLQLWFRADSLDLDDGDSVILWKDESGNKRDAAQDLGSARPEFKKNIINGYPIIRFDGTANMSLVHAVLQYNLSTYFLVWSRVGAANNDAVLMASSTTYAYLQYSALWYVFTAVSASIAMAADTFFLKSCVYDNVNYQRYTNGSAETPQAGSGDALYTYIGGTAGAVITGDIAELIIYDRNLSTSERKNVEIYLNAKYSLY